MHSADFDKNNLTRIHGALVPVEEPSTASIPEVAILIA